MLTVKHISLSGDEVLYQAHECTFSPATDDGLCPNTVWVGGDDKTPLTGGTVFVMNDNGKTVARYDLGASQIPLGADPDQPSFAEFSREKDGGLAAEAVDTLKSRAVDATLGRIHDSRLQRRVDGLAE
jgi:hypothetical protein